MQTIKFAGILLMLYNYVIMTVLYINKEYSEVAMEYYVEYIFAENFFIDFILLYITGNLFKKKIIFKKLTVASLIGAVYVILVAYVGKTFLMNWFVKISVSVLMIIVAYDAAGFITNLRLIICFYIVTLTMVGIISALYYATNNKLTVNIIIISLFSGFAILKYLFNEMKSRREKNDYMRTVNIQVNNKRKSLKAFIDTGNELSDNLTNKPVMLVNIECLKGILDESLEKEIIEFYNSKDKSLVNLFLEKNYSIKMRVIRYNTISSKGELMICIVPDEISITSNDKKIMKVNALIGIYPQRISQNNDYDALLFKKMLDWESENINEAECEIC